MTDSIPILGDSSAGFLWLGIGGAVLAIIAGIASLDALLLLFPKTPKRRTVVIASIVAALAATGAVTSFVHSSATHNATRAKQVASVSDAWDLAPSDAAALLDARGSFLSGSSVWVKLDGETQEAWLGEQYGSYLLFREGSDGDSEAVPIAR